MKQLFSRFINSSGVSALAVGISLSVGSVAAQDLPMAENASPHFNAVASQLELGGMRFSYQDQTGSNKLYLDVIKMMVGALDQHSEIKGLDADRIAELFAIDAVKASGSSTTDRGGYYHTRTFNYMPGEKSLFTQAYTSSQPSVAIGLAPVGSDLVFEFHIDARKSDEWENKMYAAAGAMGEQLKQLTEEGKNGDPMMLQWTEVQKKLNSRFVLIADIEPDYIERIEGAPVSGHAVVALTNAADIWDMLKGAGEEIKIDGDIESFEIPEVMPGMKPAFQYQRSTRTIYATTHVDYLKRCLAVRDGEVASLAADENFKKVAATLPKSYSTLCYVSPKVVETLFMAVEVFGMPQLAKEDEVTAKICQELIDSLKKTALAKTGFVYAVSPQQQGTLHVFNSPVLMPSNGFMVAMPVTLVGTSVLFVGAKYYKESADQAACIVNVSSMQKAMRSVQSIDSHAYGDPLNWQMLVGEGMPLSIKPTCPAGGEYTLSPTFPETGKPAVTCDCPGHDEYDTTGW